MSRPSPGLVILSELIGFSVLVIGTSSWPAKIWKNMNENLQEKQEKRNLTLNLIKLCKFLFFLFLFFQKKKSLGVLASLTRSPNWSWSVFLFSSSPKPSEKLLLFTIYFLLPILFMSRKIAKK